MEVGYSQFIKARRDGSWGVVPSPEGPSGWILPSLFKASVVHVPTVLIPREAFESVGVFDESVSLVEDQDMWMRLALRFPFKYIPGPVAVYAPSSREWTSKEREAESQAWSALGDRILDLLRGVPNEAEVRPDVVWGTWVHVVAPLIDGRRFDEARQALLQALSDGSLGRADGWYATRMTELTVELALALDSTSAREALFSEIEGLKSSGRVKERFKRRAFLAELWTAVALHYGAGKQRDNRVAGSAAARATLENPLKPFSRPGLIRLMVRAFTLS